MPDLFAGLYRKYYLRGCFGLSSDPERAIFHRARGTSQWELDLSLRLCIASSFRALSKLDSLYKQGAIDIGVFVTSIDKVNNKNLAL